MLPLFKWISPYRMQKSEFLCFRARISGGLQTFLTEGGGGGGLNGIEADKLKGKGAR